MSIEEIQKALENAFHEIGHAYSNIGKGLYLSALMDVERAHDAIKSAHDALNELQT